MLPFKHTAMTIFEIALRYVPYILSAIMQVEQAMAGAAGATKKALIMTAVEAASKAGEQVPEQHVQMVSGMIDSLVQALHERQIFPPHAAK